MARMGAKSYSKGYYGEIPSGGTKENKAKQSQSVRPLDVGVELPDGSKPISSYRTAQRSGKKRKIGRCT